MIIKQCINLHWYLQPIVHKKKTKHHKLRKMNSSYTHLYSTRNHLCYIDSSMSIGVGDLHAWYEPLNLQYIDMIQN